MFHTLNDGMHCSTTSTLNNPCINFYIFIWQFLINCRTFCLHLNPINAARLQQESQIFIPIPCNKLPEYDNFSFSSTFWQYSPDTFFLIFLIILNILYFSIPAWIIQNHSSWINSQMGSFSQALHKEGLHNSHFSPYIVQLIKLRRMSWMGHVALIRG